MPGSYKLRDIDTDYLHLVSQGEVLIGRDEDAHIQLDHDSISRRHAQIYNGADGIWIIDLGSTNGTFVRGEHCDTHTRLALGEIVQLGDVIVRLEPDVVYADADEHNRQRLSRESTLRPTEALALQKIREVASESQSINEPKKSARRRGSFKVPERSASDTSATIKVGASALQQTSGETKFPRPVEDEGFQFGLEFFAGCSGGLILGFLIAKLF